MRILDHLHPSVVHFPIALLIVASAAGLLYIAGRPRALVRSPAQGTVRLLIWTAMVLGWIACGAAVLTGLLAQAGLPVRAPYRGVLNWHTAGGLAALVVYGALLYLAWLQMGPRARKERARRGRPETLDLLDDPARRGLVAALLVLGAALVFLTGFNGGQLVYVWGVNVGP